jgi:nicotinate-nucleotide adenylyltransferase
MASTRITTKSKVGVFGGTFDPIHEGHIAVATAVLEKFELDQVLFVVTSDQWLRENPPEASASQRLHMVELTVDNTLEFVASDVDIVREGSTYTVDTLTDLHDQLGADSELYLIVGADSALSMDRWKNGSKIPALAKIVAVGRPGEDFDTSSLDDSHPASGAEYLEGPMVDVSATRVRGFLAAGEPVGELITREVVGYIEQQGLYR